MGHFGGVPRWGAGSGVLFSWRDRGQPAMPPAHQQDDVDKLHLHEALLKVALYPWLILLFLCLCSVFIAMWSICGKRASHPGAFSCCRSWALGAEGFSSRGSRARDHGLRSCGARDLLLQHAGSSRTRDRSCGSCICRQILYH